MSEPPSFTHRLFARASRETAVFTHRKLLMGLLMGLITRIGLRVFGKVRVTWSDVWRDVLIFVLSYVVVLLISFIVNLLRAAASLDQERADEIAALTEKLKLAEPLNRQREIRLAFAKLMDDGRVLQIRMSETQGQHEFADLGREMVAWVVRTYNALVGAEMNTDAIAFRDSGHEPSPDKIEAAAANRFQPWKQYALAQLAAYAAKLQEIVERRNL